MAYGYQLECELAKLGISASIKGKDWHLSPIDSKATPWYFNSNTGRLYKAPPRGDLVDEIRATPERTAEIIASHMKPAWVEKPARAIKEAKDASGS